MSTPLLQLGDIEPSIRTGGVVHFQIAGYDIALDLKNRHERNYAASLLLNVAYPQSDIDSMLFDVALRSGDVILDAGANIGFTALKCLSMGAARVIAVEPVPEIFKRLAQVSQKNIIAINKAISSTVGRQQLVVSQAHNQGSTLKSQILSLFPAIFGKDPPSVDVETTTIDALADLHGPFDVWKMDIEGSEVDALHGASRTLYEAPPRVIIAELFGSLPGDFCVHLEPIYCHKYRALIRRSDYKLVLADYNTVYIDDFHPISPTYVFSQEPMACAGRYSNN